MNNGVIDEKWIGIVYTVETILSSWLMKNGVINEKWSA